MDYALWSDNTPLQIMNVGTSHDRFITGVGDSNTETSIPAITMPEVIEIMGGSVDLLKLDIEGAEKEVFAAEDVSWLNDVDTLAIETHDHVNPGSAKSVYNALSRYDYNLYIDGLSFYVVKSS